MTTLKRCSSLAGFEAVESKFIDDDRAERLTYETVEDYISSVMEDMEHGTSDEDAESKIIAMAPLTVVAYIPAMRDRAERDRWVHDIAKSLSKSLYEAYYEDLGDPRNEPPTLSPSEMDEMKVILARWLDRVGVWRCEPVGWYEMTADDIREVLARSK